MKYLCLLCFLSPDLCSLWLCIESLVSTLHHFRCRQHVCPLLRPSAWAGSHLLPLAGLTLVSFHGLAQLPFSRRETGGVHTSINWKPVSVFFYVFGINRFLWWVSLYKLDTICTSWKKKKRDTSPCYLLERVILQAFSVGFWLKTRKKQSKQKQYVPEKQQQKQSFCNIKKPE